VKAAAVRVLIVDDSAVARGVLAAAMRAQPDIHLVGTAIHGEAGLRVLHRHPVDVVILDVEMPVLDGLATLARIAEEFPDVRVIMASALTGAGAEVTVRALQLGAADCIAKPQTGDPGENIRRIAAQLVPLVKALGAVRPRPASPSTSARRAQALLPAAGRSVPEIIVMGASTGGPKAVTTVLSALPGDLMLPVLLVQHMPPLFTATVARHLGRDTRRPSREAADGAIIEPGSIYVAPGDRHLLIERRGERLVSVLDDGPPEHYCRPSVNPLFRSAASSCGEGVLAVVLTGMAEDGLEGARRVVERGGRVIAQDEATSVVWGMPGAVVRHGLCDCVLPVDQIGPAIEHLCRQPARQP
jgi:two-component system chemotaxis response regulator CheB